MATGFDAFTSGSTSSSAARRLTKVVLAWRMKSGKREIASSSASRWLPSARKVALALPTNAASSLRFSASALTSVELSWRKRDSSGESRLSSPNSRLEVDSAGLR